MSGEMPNTTNAQPHPLHWDSLILVVYSVLVGLSLDKNFDFFASSPDHLPAAILMLGLLIVVLENWIYLPTYLRQVDIESTSEASLYLFAIIGYSCIPALYLAKPSLWDLSAPEWIALNFALICILDAITKAFTVRKMYKKPREALTDGDREVVGSYLFYSTTGLFYGALLILECFFLANSNISPLQKAITVTGSWVVIRVIDRLSIKWLIGILLDMLWNGRK